ncbi:RloB family protein [Tumidithrix elongata RA019]|uniref:RloB family protein n=1 Tax=Tumidithrix elongata BACA0141 TaxID=2716417 RepID=A0AAW9PUE7_9CYAN|nr:RloB family protein [Tumidithrix elongata RA019]
MGKPFKRNPLKKPVGNKILIACEGENTEIIYFKAIRQKLRLPREQIIVISPEGTDPLTIVNEAIAERDELKYNRAWEKDDSAWAVFDGDEHIDNNYSRWCEALLKAERNKINLAISNPSIEFWFLIH